MCIIWVFFSFFLLQVHILWLKSQELYAVFVRKDSNLRRNWSLMITVFPTVGLTAHHADQSMDSQSVFQPPGIGTVHAPVMPLWDLNQSWMLDSAHVLLQMIHVLDADLWAVHWGEWEMTEVCLWFNMCENNYLFYSIHGNYYIGSQTYLYPQKCFIHMIMSNIQICQFNACVFISPFVGLAILCSNIIQEHLIPKSFSVPYL